jgi:hypothetical protein
MLICAVCVTIAARPRSPQSSSPSAQAEPGKQSNQEINDGFVPQGHFINCSTYHRGSVDPLVAILD